MKKLIAVVFCVVLFCSCGGSSEIVQLTPEILTHFQVELPEEIANLNIPTSAVLITTLPGKESVDLVYDTSIKKFATSFAIKLNAEYDIQIVIKSTDASTGKSVHLVHLDRKKLKAQFLNTVILYSEIEAPKWDTKYKIDGSENIPNALDDDGDNFSNIVEVAYGSSCFDRIQTPNAPTVEASLNAGSFPVNFNLSPGNEIESQSVPEDVEGLEISLSTASFPFNISEVTLSQPKVGHQILTSIDEINSTHKVRVKFDSSMLLDSGNNYFFVVLNIKDIFGFSWPYQFSIYKEGTIAPETLPQDDPNAPIISNLVISKIDDVLPTRVDPLRPNDFKISWNAKAIDGKQNIQKFILSLRINGKPNNHIECELDIGQANGVPTSDAYFIRAQNNLSNCPIFTNKYGEYKDSFTLASRGQYRVKVTIVDKQNRTAHIESKFYIAEYPQLDLVGWWRFDELEGTNLLPDYSGNENSATHIKEDTTNAKPRLINGLVDKSYKLDGLKEHAQVSGTDLNFKDQDFTIEAWVKVTGKARLDEEEGGYYPLVTSNGSGANTLGLSLLAGYDYSESSSHSAWAMGNESNEDSFKLLNNQALVLNQWYQVVLTRFNQEVSLYVNGRLVHTNSEILAQYLTDDGTWQFGYMFDNDSFINAEIDEVAFYKRTLSEDEVRKNCRKFALDESICPSIETPIIVWPKPQMVVPATRYYWRWRAEENVSEGPKPNITYTLSYKTTLNNVTSATTLVTPTKNWHAGEHKISDQGKKFILTVKNNGGSADASSTVEYFLNNSLVSWWKFNNTDDLFSAHTAKAITDTALSKPVITAKDGLCSLNTSTFSNADAYDGSGCFSGKKYIPYLPVNNNGYGKEFSIEARVKIPSDFGINSNYSIAGRWGQAKSFVLSALDTAWSGTAFYTHADINLNPVISKSQNNSIDDGFWHNIVGTYNGFWNILMVDGELRGAEFQEGNLLFNKDDYMCIGTSCFGNQPAYDSFFFGLIDEVIIYKSALSPEAARTSNCAAAGMNSTTSDIRFPWYCD